jgi:hypothetical protein
MIQTRFQGLLAMRYSFIWVKIQVSSFEKRMPYVANLTIDEVAFND